MVKTTRYLSAFFNLVRWPNLLIMALTQVLVRQCLLVPILKTAHMDVQLPAAGFILLIAGTVLIAAGGYTINDYFDRKIDRVNRPDHMIVGSRIHPRRAMAYHLILTSLGIVAGSFAAWITGKLYLSLIFIMVSGLLWFYSTTYKREFLLGNIIVALLTGFVPFIVLLFELPLLAESYGSDVQPIIPILLSWILGFATFAFLVNLVREIIKDCEDFEGDQAYGKKTIPVIWSMFSARIIASVILLLVSALLIFIWFMFLREYFTLAYFAFMLVAPLLLLTFMLLRRNPDQKKWHQISLGLKIIMLNGLGYMIAANLIINYLQ